jgi:monofunctional biosynthetic peptidoglycan transglycosylase
MTAWQQKRSGIWRRVGQSIMAVLAIGLGCLSYTWLTLPDVRPLRTQTPATTAFMRMRAAEAAAAGHQAGFAQKLIRYHQISPLLIRAVLVAEDAAFFSHDGVDYDELKESIELNWEKGEFVRGASTITQQLAKNLYLSSSRNPYRKVTELFITRRLEAELPKARILEIYLNVIEWGDGIWGCEAASERYFGVSASDLSADQAALLAASIINPRIYSPARPNPRLLRRQQLILTRMRVGQENK